MAEYRVGVMAVSRRYTRFWYLGNLTNLIKNYVITLLMWKWSSVSFAPHYLWHWAQPLWFLLPHFSWAASIVTFPALCGGGEACANICICITLNYPVIEDLQIWGQVFCGLKPAVLNYISRGKKMRPEKSHRFPLLKYSFNYYTKSCNTFLPCSRRLKWK